MLNTNKKGNAMYDTTIAAKLLGQLDSFWNYKLWGWIAELTAPVSVRLLMQWGVGGG